MDTESEIGTSTPKTPLLKQPQNAEDFLPESVRKRKNDAERLVIVATPRNLRTTKIFDKHLPRNPIKTQQGV